jgi:hypothetical protein
MGTRVVHEAEIAGIVHVQIDVDVVGPDTETDAIFFEDAECGQGFNVLPEGQRRDPDKVDEL